MLRRWFDKNAAILLNAGSLLGTRVVTSGFGFIYWWMAARLIEPDSVGLGSAAISAMMLLSMIGVLGMGTLMIGELPRRPDQVGSLLLTALLASGGASLALGLLFALLAPVFSHELAALGDNPWNVLLFAGGVALSTITLVLDQALIGLLRGQVQLWRNVWFSSIKLAVLLPVGLWVDRDLGLLIYATWAFGNLISVLYVVWASRPSTRITLTAFRPQWGLLRDLKDTAFKHYALNMSLQVPGFALPLIVTVLLSTTANASFYAAWMIITFLFTMPHALSMVLFAVGAADPSLLAGKIRFTLGMSLAVSLAGAAVLVIGAEPIMRLFGDTYAEQASASLRVMALAVFPSILKVHFVAVSQIQGRMLNAARVMAVGGLCELSLAALGAHLDGQLGLSIGWTAGICIEAVLSAPLVFQTATSGWKRLAEVGQPG